MKKIERITQLKAGDVSILSLVPTVFRGGGDDEIVIRASDYLRDNYGLYHIPEIVVVGQIKDLIPTIESQKHDLRRLAVLVGVEDLATQPDGMRNTAHILCRHPQATSEQFFEAIAQVMNAGDLDMEGLWTRTNWFQYPFLHE